MLTYSKKPWLDGFRKILGFIRNYFCQIKPSLKASITFFLFLKVSLNRREIKTWLIWSAKTQVVIGLVSQNLTGSCVNGLKIARQLVSALIVFFRRKWQPTLGFLPGEFHAQGAWQATVYRVARVAHDWVTKYTQKNPLCSDHSFLPPGFQATTDLFFYCLH